MPRPMNFDVTGTVYADLNGNGKFDGNDAPVAERVRVLGRQSQRRLRMPASSAC